MLIQTDVHFWFNFSKDHNKWGHNYPLIDVVLIFLSLHILFSLLKQTGRKIQFQKLTERKMCLFGLASPRWKTLTMHINLN